MKLYAQNLPFFGTEAVGVFVVYITVSIDELSSEVRRI
jgi:hypothetical protein